MSEFIAIGPVSRFPQDRTTEVVVGGRDICVARAGEDWSAFDNTCTHADAALSSCPVENGRVSCPLHGAQFDVRTGEAKTLPATEPLRMHELRIDGDTVLIRLSA